MRLLMDVVCRSARYLDRRRVYLATDKRRIGIDYCQGIGAWIGRSGHGDVDRADVREVRYRERDGNCDGGKDRESQCGDSEVECGVRSRGSARRPTGDSVSVVIVSLL